ncbi:hypothetical protein UJ101_01330 [Flavobacteriaceae bacterium UJ101]|nr:hypothetical protein UJ101_01330 [Flavobacteriaceae bacterium UJ101]
MPKKFPEYNFRTDFEDLGFEMISLDDFRKRNYPNLSAPHKINFYNILFITEGTGKHYINFESYSLKKGSLLFIGKNQVHSWVKNNQLQGYITLFTERFLYQNQLEFNELSYGYPYNINLYSPLVQTTQQDFLSLSSLTNFLYQEYNTESNTSKEEILQCLLRVFILKIQSQTPQNEKTVDPYLKNIFIDFQKLLNQNSTLTRNVKDYCEMLNVSYHQLNIACKTLVNQTAKVFIDDMVILNAKKLLADPTHNTNEIAYLIGFDEPSNFIKFFKKHTGKTPKHFKEKLTN